MKRVAIIGGGISGLIHAHVLGKNGLQAVVFEQGLKVGGVWSFAYPGVRLQNVDFQYHLSDVPWPTRPHFHPSGEQIHAYWEQVASKLDVRLETEVVSAEPVDGGWRVVTRKGEETQEHAFDYLVAAVGQYSLGKHRPHFEGEERFDGSLGTERDVLSLSTFAGKRVVVVGFGKSALELPNVEAMEQSVERVRAWKRANIAFEPSRSCAISTRYQQYLDILLFELGVSPYRKLPNVVAELFARYGAVDYAGVTEQVLKRSGQKRRALPLDA